MRDGKANLVTYQLENGTYVIPKVTDSGCCARPCYLNRKSASALWAPFGERCCGST
jgi:hypothetical protein